MLVIMGKHSVNQAVFLQLQQLLASSRGRPLGFKKRTISRTEPELDPKYTGLFIVWLLYLSKHFGACYIWFLYSSIRTSDSAQWAFSIKTIMYIQKNKNKILFCSTLFHNFMPFMVTIVIIPLTNVNWLKQYKT